jgi:hypothetical protein
MRTDDADRLSGHHAALRRGSHGIAKPGRGEGDAFGNDQPVVRLQIDQKLIQIQADVTAHVEEGTGAEAFRGDPDEAAETDSVGV